MAKRYLFSVLSEQPWWLTLLVAIFIFGVMQLVFPPLAPFVALPFAAVAGFLAWRQMRAGPSVNVEERLSGLRAMPGGNFSLVVGGGHRRPGYSGEEAKSAAFDFRLAKKGQITLVQCRRWKVNQVGDAPVRELVNAMEKQGAFNCVCLTAGAFSANARDFARGRPITLLNGAALVELARTMGKKRWRWFSR